MLVTFTNRFCFCFFVLGFSKVESNRGWSRPARLATPTTSQNHGSCGHVDNVANMDKVAADKAVRMFKDAADKKVTSDSPQTTFGDATIFCGNFMLPKRRFWKEEQEMKCGCSMNFSMVSGPNRVLTTLKSASNIRISSLVPPSKIFVWEV
jgi:hypothetical protein